MSFASRFYETVHCVVEDRSENENETRQRVNFTPLSVFYSRTQIFKNMTFTSRKGVNIYQSGRQHSLFTALLKKSSYTCITKTLWERYQ